jgi:hypothetical protein
VREAARHLPPGATLEQCLRNGKRERRRAPSCLLVLFKYCCCCCCRLCQANRCLRRWWELLPRLARRWWQLLCERWAHRPTANQSLHTQRAQPAQGPMDSRLQMPHEHLWPVPSGDPRRSNQMPKCPRSALPIIKHRKPQAVSPHPVDSDTESTGPTGRSTRVNDA